MQAAEKLADAVAREALPAVAMKDHKRCNGTGVYTFVSGTKGDCAGCYSGKVPATREAKATLEAAEQERELRRLRIMWTGARNALRANPSKQAEAEFRALMASMEARAALVKAGKAA
jgi:hypothetical protein